VCVGLEAPWIAPRRVELGLYCPTEKKKEKIPKKNRNELGLYIMNYLL
jgi:hypothetical protein